MLPIGKELASLPPAQKDVYQVGRERECLAGIWRNRSVLGQILAVMIGIELGAAMIGAAAIIYAMRQQNEAEMGTAMARAETLVRAEIASALIHTSPESTLET